jgi:antitoxin ParD1/3/4
MATATMNISLPEGLRDFVKDRVEQDHHGTPSAYLRNLIIQDKKRAAEEKLEALLLEGINSGEAVEVGDEYWDKFKDRLKARVQAKSE